MSIQHGAVMDPEGFRFRGFARTNYFIFKDLVKSSN